MSIIREFHRNRPSWCFHHFSEPHNPGNGALGHISVGFFPFASMIKSRREMNWGLSGGGSVESFTLEKQGNIYV